MKVILIFYFFAKLTFAEKDWWKTANIYQIYPRSFKDSDDDGIGDIQGIIQKLNYIKELNVTAIWLNSFFKSPQVDLGYDVEDFYNVDPIFGTMADLEELFEKVHELELKIILDLIPNHTSDFHKWFIKSVIREGKYTDYYVWHDGKPNREGGQNIEPNNWQAVFSTRAWSWNEHRQQYYLHQFTSSQPDLNYRNPAVVQEMKDILTFWLEKGVDGFRVVATNHLFEVEDLRDEIQTGWTNDPNNYGFTHHHYTKDLDETYGNTRVIFTDAYANLTFTMRYYGSEIEPNAHFPFNYLLIDKLNENSNAHDFKREIDEWFINLPNADATSNWILGNHDKPRLASRYGIKRVDGMLMLLLLLPGVSITWNGDEIGMVDFREGISWEDTVDPQACNINDPINYKWVSRDPQRTPFQWDSTHAAGFCTTCKSWLPVNDNYRILNLENQRTADKSFFKLFKKLSSLRKNEIFVNGNFESYSLGSEIFAFKRTYNLGVYIIIINLSNNQHTINIHEISEFNYFLQVIIAGSRSNYNDGEIVHAKELLLNGYDALVLKKKNEEECSNNFNKICRYYIDHNNRYTCIIEDVDKILTSISGSHISPLFTDTNVTQVYLKNSVLTQIPSIIFSKFLNLEFLSITNCSLGGIFDTIPSCNKLTHLDASFNNIYHLSNTAFKNCKNLKTIDITGNSLKVISREIFDLNQNLNKIILNGEI
ncbi:hypothetical protein PVAND_006497 [Polypedilum vanderplanki]|uniref:alpha-glucosidase n=1 Tax=Polypedilum vanderplanki TaxID=319348 RepID=A0A9J6C3D6_POLVA|nr:hypothetical protein PVAND_006497 [Polypedilum vanderplanki]